MPAWSGSLLVMRTVLPGLSSFVVVVGDVSAGVAGVSVGGGGSCQANCLALVGRFSVGCCVDGHAPEPMIQFFPSYTNHHRQRDQYSHILACSDTIGRTEGYACKVIREDSNGRKVSDRVDLQRTCDDTMPTWETLEYSQRFKSKECLDLVINDGKK